jgi:hypothetical protein
VSVAGEHVSTSAPSRSGDRTSIARYLLVALGVLLLLGFAGRRRVVARQRLRSRSGALDVADR